MRASSHQSRPMSLRMAGGPDNSALRTFELKVPRAAPAIAERALDPMGHPPDDAACGPDLRHADGPLRPVAPVHARAQGARWAVDSPESSRHRRYAGIGSKSTDLGPRHSSGAFRLGGAPVRAYVGATTSTGRSDRGGADPQRTARPVRAPPGPAPRLWPRHDRRQKRSGPGPDPAGRAASRIAAIAGPSAGPGSSQSRDRRVPYGDGRMGGSGPGQNTGESAGRALRGGRAPASGGAFRRS